jgi:chromosome segregation ATPase
VTRALSWLVAALERRLLGTSAEEIRYTFEDVRSEIRATRAELKAEIAELRREIERLEARLPPPPEPRGDKPAAQV